MLQRPYILKKQKTKQTKKKKTKTTKQKKKPKPHCNSRNKEKKGNQGRSQMFLSCTNWTVRAASFTGHRHTYTPAHSFWKKIWVIFYSRTKEICSLVMKGIFGLGNPLC